MEFPISDNELITVIKTHIFYFLNFYTKKDHINNLYSEPFGLIMDAFATL